MEIKDFETFITLAFTQDKLDIVEGKNEYGFTHLIISHSEQHRYATKHH